MLPHSMRILVAHAAELLRRPLGAGTSASTIREGEDPGVSPTERLSEAREVSGLMHAAVNAQFERLLDYVGEKLPSVAEHLDAARADLLAFTTFPKDVWVQIWSNPPQAGGAPTSPNG